MSIFETDGKVPRARTEGLLAERVDGDLVVYDALTKSAHCLSPEAASVWDRCDGRASQGDVARQLALSPATVAKAVEELRDAGLTVETGITRRDAAKRGAALGALAMTASTGTLLTTMAVPAAAAACSQPNNGCCTGLAPACWPEASLELMAPYGLFAMTGGTVNVNLAQVDGDIGVASGGSIKGMNLKQNATPTVPSPSVFVDPGGTFNVSGFSGGPIVSQSESSVQAAALNVSSTASNILTSCPSAVNLGSQGNTSASYTETPGTPTLYVVTVSSLTGGNTITLNGNSNSFWILNFTGDIDLTSGGVVVNGFDAGNVILNQPNTGVKLNSNINAHLSGVFVSLHGSNGGQFEQQTGSAFIGGTITIMSNAVMRQVGCLCRCP